MLEINNLRKNFNNQTQALKGVSLKVKKGEFISILGPSGSGKTTLLRSLNGLETIDSGEVIFDNKKITKETLHYVRNKTGMIFQEFNLVNNISSINNVLTGLLNSSSKFLSMFYLFTKEQKLKALQALDTVGLLDKSYNRADELSGGQRQAVAIARATAFNAKIVIMDEPTAALAVKEVGKVLDLILNLKNLGVSVIVISHRMDDIFSVCDRVMALFQGTNFAESLLKDTSRDEVIGWIMGKKD